MQLVERDPRRNKPLLDFINSQAVDFSADSTFAITKRLTLISVVSDALQWRLQPQVDKLMKLYFDNIQTPYAEVSIVVLRYYLRLTISSGSSPNRREHGHPDQHQVASSISLTRRRACRMCRWRRSLASPESRLPASDPGVHFELRSVERRAFAAASCLPVDIRSRGLDAPAVDMGNSSFTASTVHLPLRDAPSVSLLSFTTRCVVETVHS